MEGGRPGFAAHEKTLRDYLRTLFRQKAVIFLSIFVVSAGVAFGLKLKTPIYQAQVKILISGQKHIEAPYYSDLGIRDSQEVLTQSQIVKSSPVLQRVIDSLRLYNRPLDYEKRYASPLKGRLIEWTTKKRIQELERYPVEQRQAMLYVSVFESLKQSIEIEPVKGSNIFAIKVQDYSPIGAAILANAISRSYVIFDLEQQLADIRLKYTEKHLAVTQLQDSINEMKKWLDGKPLPNIEAMGPASVKIVEQASVPVKPEGLPESLLMMLGFSLSIVLGVILAFLFESLDQSFRSKPDLEAFLNAPVLACINKKKHWGHKKLIKNPDAKFPKAQSYRILADQIHFLLKHKNIRSILIAPIASKEGASTIIANLGLFMSKKMGHEVLIIDANLRRPAMQRLFSAQKRPPVSPGLCEVLEGKARMEEVIGRVDEKVSLLPAGQSTLDPGILLDTAVSEGVLGSIPERFSVVLVDSANLRDYKDAAVICPAVDGVILVISEGSVRRQVVKTALIPLQEKKGNILGTIMNDRSYVIPKILYNWI